MLSIKLCVNLCEKGYLNELWSESLQKWFTNHNIKGHTVNKRNASIYQYKNMSLFYKEVISIQIVHNLPPIVSNYNGTSKSWQRETLKDKLVCEQTESFFFLITLFLSAVYSSCDHAMQIYAVSQCKARVFKCI